MYPHLYWLIRENNHHVASGGASSPRMHPGPRSLHVMIRQNVYIGWGEVLNQGGGGGFSIVNRIQNALSDSGLIHVRVNVQCKSTCCALLYMLYIQLKVIMCV